MTDCHGDRNFDLGPFAGPIYVIILCVQCLFFLFLEWWLPREAMDYVPAQWDISTYTAVNTIIEVQLAV
jgi:phosphatidylinositol glycan class A protein